MRMAVISLFNPEHGSQFAPHGAVRHATLFTPA